MENNQTKEKLLAEIGRLKKELRQKKKYGLVWEDKPEDVVEMCKEKLPVLKEVKSKEIITDKSKPVNLLIEGDNYHVLSVLNYTHKGKIDVIYIDPPYNTGNKDFVYNDQYVDKEDVYRHSKWASFMYKRLSLSKALLKSNGSIFISIDDNEYPRLMMLIEEIFGENKLKTVCVKMSEATGVKMASVIRNGRIPKLKEYLVIAKKDGIKNLYLEKLPKEKWDNEYKTYITNVSEKEINQVKEIRDNEDRTKKDVELCNKLVSEWKTCSLSEYFTKNNISKKDQEDFKYKNAWRILQIATLTGGARDTASQIKQGFDKIPNFFCLTTPQKKMYLISGSFNHETKLPRCKVLFADDYLTIHPGDFWTDIKTTGLDNEGGIDFKNGKKPLRLIEKIIKTYENKQITVLDFFAGSGTTGEALLKVNNEDGGTRNFILCTYNEENGNGKIVDEFCYPRLKNAISGYGAKMAYGGNLKYFKTAFVDYKESTDRNKIKLTKEAVEMLCVKEGTFESVMESKEFKIFKNHNHHTGIIFDQLAIKEFKKAIKDIKGKFSVYVFSLGDDSFEDEFEDIKQKVKLSPIPEAILKVYRRIFK